jgi:hypothetical protein
MSFYAMRRLFADLVVLLGLRLTVGLRLRFVNVSVRLLFIAMASARMFAFVRYPLLYMALKISSGRFWSRGILF